MNYTITIDIINEKVLKILLDLEQLNLIRLRLNNKSEGENIIEQFKGTLTKKNISDVDQQLKELRSGWE